MYIKFMPKNTWEIKNFLTDDKLAHLRHLTRYKHFTGEHCNRLVESYVESYCLLLGKKSLKVVNAAMRTHFDFLFKNTAREKIDITAKSIRADLKARQAQVASLKLLSESDQVCAFDNAGNSNLKHQIYQLTSRCNELVTVVQSIERFTTSAHGPKINIFEAQLAEDLIKHFTPLFKRSSKFSLIKV